jgi:hypothetical protein
MLKSTSFLVSSVRSDCPKPISTGTAVQLGGDWYNKLGVPRTFQVAVDACASSGGQLAVIYDQASHDAIYQLIGTQFF